MSLLAQALLAPPWPTVLTAEEVARAEGYYGTGRRLRHLAAKLLGGRPIKVGWWWWVGGWVGVGWGVGGGGGDASECRVGEEGSVGRAGGVCAAHV